MTLPTAPAGRPFVKMHGLRNHFVIVDARTEPYRPPADAIAHICDLQTGVGGDQLIVIEPPQADNAHAFMRIYNVDGREVEACGNATRCVGWLLLQEAGADAIVVETLAGLLQCRRAGELRVSSDMGSVSMQWQEIPLAEKRDTLHLDFSCGELRNPVALAIGNPHLVFFVDNIDAVDLEKYAPDIQKDRLFPNGINVGIAEMQADDRMRVVVYERGAGLTAACGSGACVAAYAARARGLTAEDRITVEMPAGTVDIDVRPDGSAVMTGPVAFCFRGELPA